MRIALIQHAFKGDKSSTVQKSVEMIKEAKEQGAELVILQELHQGRYFCITEDVNNFDLAEDFEKDLRFWSRVAEENEIVLVSSLFEKRASGLYHNTAVVFDKDGSLCGKYRKMHIPDDPGFYEKFYFTPGDLGFEPIDTSVGRLGVLVCWDQWYPEAARIMALKGAEILIYPTAIGWFDEDSEVEKQRQYDAWFTVQRGHAVANGAFVVAVNRVGFEKDESNAIEGIRFWGASFVAGPQGEILAKASHEKEEVLVVDIDRKRVDEVRKIWPFFRDRRIEAFGDILKRFCD